MTLGERIKASRARAGLSQEKLAELVGVSRQAVTKWEADQTAPSTENLFRLAAVLGTTVEGLMGTEKPIGPEAAEALCRLLEDERKSRAHARRARLRATLRWTLGIAGGYLAVYLLGRLLCSDITQQSLLGWLTGTDSHDYLFGWLLSSRMFWFAMALSVLPALLGRYRLAAVMLCGFALGIPLGEWFGQNPAGAAYGHGHYGWAIWGGLFFASAILGAVLERMGRKGISLRTRAGLLWAGAAVGSALLIILLVRGSMPDFASV